MKKLQNLSYRAQIFFASLSLVILPSILLGLFAVNDSTAKIVREYNKSFTTILSQANITLDALLQDAAKVADMPILSEDVRKAMITDYGDDYLTYARTSTRFRDLFNQTNRLNTDVETCIFTNRYGYSFEYNVTSTLHKRQINQNIETWADAARKSPNYTYFAPLQHSAYSSTGKKILPMVKILHDKYDFREIGICYVEINFKPIEEILRSAQSSGNTLFIYNSDGTLTFSSNPAYMQETEEHAALLQALRSFSRSLVSGAGIAEDRISDSRAQYQVNGCVNQSANWRLVQFVGDQTSLPVYRENILNYVRIFFVSVILGILLAVVLSGTLTRSISLLCRQIDAADTGQIDERACGSNTELRRLVVSFNDLSKRLTSSLQQNYKIQLAEQRMRIQMLQFQINHHFLYNTLNVIRSLANLHNVPEIATVAVCMSDLLRYNLQKFPVASLREELDQLNRYMTIQNIRFPGKFHFDYSFPPSLLNMKIPAFLLQPFVENSIEHGFASREADCCISISCHETAQKLHIFIADNGCGIPPQMTARLNRECQSDAPAGGAPENERHSIGIKNVSQRIRGYFGNEYGVSIESMENEGTIIEIVLPSPA